MDMLERVDNDFVTDSDILKHIDKPTGLKNEETQRESEMISPKILKANNSEASYIAPTSICSSQVPSNNHAIVGL